MTTTETTPLLSRSDGEGKTQSRLGWWLRRTFSVENRILLAGLIITLSFTFTQVPILYVFRRMTCDVFYDNHPLYEGHGDRCSRDEIAAGTATQFSILGMSTTICGTINLFVTGWMVKKLGPRFTLIVQTVVPAIRVAAQITGLIAGKRAGIIIIQCTQLITMLGGPAGYILVTNIIAGEVVEPERRTATFGRLQGAAMLGQALGFIAGGTLGNVFNIRTPFEVAFFAFLISAIYVQISIPYISPDSMSDSKNTNQRSASGFLAPLKILVPQRLLLADGRLKKHYGVIFLCSGIFVGVLATDYAPLLIQMYATAQFDFDQQNNGWLMSEFAVMRALFLIFIFPWIITKGRAYMTRKSRSPDVQADSEGGVSDQNSNGGLPTAPGSIDAPTAEQSVTEPVKSPDDSSKDPSLYHFDLVFLRWSLVVDGLMTTISAFATQSWHIYLAAFLLPFGSGSAPAAKGVITQMCTPSQRADALNAVTLIENIARLTTQGLFGFIFASLAGVGKAYATFFCNAALAVVGMGVLLFSHFPPAGSELIDSANNDGDLDESSSEENEDAARAN